MGVYLRREIGPFKFNTYLFSYKKPAVVRFSGHKSIGLFNSSTIIRDIIVGKNKKKQDILAVRLELNHSTTNMKTRRRILKEKDINDADISTSRKIGSITIYKKSIVWLPDLRNERLMG